MANNTPVMDADFVAQLVIAVTTQVLAQLQGIAPATTPVATQPAPKSEVAAPAKVEAPKAKRTRKVAAKPEVAAVVEPAKVEAPKSEVAAPAKVETPAAPKKRAKKVAATTVQVVTPEPKVEAAKPAALPALPAKSVAITTHDGVAWLHFSPGSEADERRGILANLKAAVEAAPWHKHWRKDGSSGSAKFSYRPFSLAYGHAYMTMLGKEEDIMPKQVEIAKALLGVLYPKVAKVAPPAVKPAAAVVFTA